MKTIPQYVGKTPVKLLEQRDDVTVFRAVGVPFGGPEFLQGKDLHGQFFDKSTDYGKNSQGEVVVKNVYAYYNHGFHDKLGTENIGFAKYYTETDEGQVWDIEVLRAYRYHDMLLSLAEKGLLGASSQPVQTTVDIDYDSGMIKRWHVAEISLTPTPANPDAVVSVLKSHNVSQDEIDGFMLTFKTDADKPDVEDTFAKEIEDLFKDLGVEQPDKISIETAGLAKLLAAVGTIEASVKQLSDEVKTVKETTTKGITDVLAQVTSTKNGVKSFAANVVKQLKMETGKLVDEEFESEAEKAAREQRDAEKNKSGGYIPTNAPGFKN